MSWLPTGARCCAGEVKDRIVILKIHLGCSTIFGRNDLCVKIEIIEGEFISWIFGSSRPGAVG